MALPHTILHWAFFAQLYADVGGSTIAEDGELDRISRVFVRQGAADGIVTRYRLAVNRHNQVATDGQLRITDLHCLMAAAQAGVIGRRAGLDFGDQQSTLRREGLEHRRSRRPPAPPKRRAAAAFCRPGDRPA